MRRISTTFATSLVGLFLLLLGLGFLWFGTRNLIKMWAWEKLTLKNNSEAMIRWIKPPEPVSFKVYIFNVTNSEAVSEGALPNLTEVGPYVYEQVRQKINITQMENYTLSYRLHNMMRFKESLSGGLKESDTVTVLNVPLAGAILLIYEAAPEFAGMMEDIWPFFYPGQRNVFITTTVRNLLFDGITIDCSSKITEVYIACRALETRKTYSVRREGKNFKFSFFHAKNGTSKETYQVNQGVYNLKKSAQYTGVNKLPLINKWRNRYCDLVNGSDGAQFPVKLEKTQKLYIYEKDLCRSLYIEFEKVIKKNGVLLYKYSNTPGLFSPPEENPNNICFCRPLLNIRDVVEEEPEIGAELDANISRKCFLKGALSLMPCVGAPMVASFPHFYLGDESYINYSGLNPVKELHETYVTVEPSSGIAISGFKRLQFNLEVRKIPDVQITSKLREGLFPILWVEEEMELSKEFFKMLRYTLVEIKILQYGTFVLIGLGSFLIIVANVVRFVIGRSICYSTKTLPEAGDSSDSRLSGAVESSVFVQKSTSLLPSWQQPEGKVSWATIPDSLIGFKGQANDAHFRNQSLVDNFM